MKSTSFVILILFLLVSCKKDPRYETRIVLINSLDSTIHVDLYPKPEFCYQGLYKASSIGSGYTEKSFSLQGLGSKYLYYSDNYSISAQGLLSQIFDSVSLSVSFDTTIKIKFNPNSFQHYTQNIFSSSSIWKFRSFDEDRKTMGTSEIIHVRQFEFSVKKDSIR